MNSLSGTIMYIYSGAIWFNNISFFKQYIVVCKICKTYVVSLPAIWPEKKTLPQQHNNKAQQTRMLSWTQWVLCKCFKVKSILNVKISTKLQLQNLDQTRLQNLDLNSISKSRQNFSFKILTKIQLQSLDKTSLSISWQIFMFKIFTKHQLQNPDQTVVNTFLRINISNTNNIKKGQVGIFNASVTSIKSQQHEFS